MGGSHSKDGSNQERVDNKQVKLAKKVIQSYFADMEKVQMVRTRKRAQLEDRIRGLNEEQKEAARQEFMQEMMRFHFISRNRTTVADFAVVRQIGKGSFGEVFLVRHKQTQQHYAMKILDKERMIEKGHVAHAWVERYALSRAGRHPNVVELFFCFQDRKYLYLVMEYVPGGDMLTMLMREKRLSEEWARFYLGELIIAIETLHVEGIIHRDLKPDNVLFNSEGHIRLSDFGLSKVLYTDPELQDVAKQSEFEVESNSETESQSRSSISTYPTMTTEERIAKWKELSREKAFSAVGTPNYIAPEVLLTGRYDETSDWWSVGIIMYEMLVGYPPFWSSSSAHTCRKILGWRENLKFPKDNKMSEEAKSLILKLICAPRERLGRTEGVKEFQEHPWFAGKIDFDKLPEMQPPFVPELKGAEDTRYFDEAVEGVGDDAVARAMSNSEDEAPTFEQRHRLRKSLNASATWSGYTFINLSAMGNLPDWAAEEMEDDLVVTHDGESMEAEEELLREISDAKRNMKINHQLSHEEYDPATPPVPDTLSQSRSSNSLSHKSSLETEEPLKGDFGGEAPHEEPPAGAQPDTLDDDLNEALRAAEEATKASEIARKGSDDPAKAAQEIPGVRHGKAKVKSVRLNV